MLKAALIHGIQDHPGDWKDFETSCSDFMQITRIERPAYTADLDHKGKWLQWGKMVQNDCLMKMGDKGFDLVIGHSGGCRYIADLFQKPENRSETVASDGNRRTELPDIGILLNPPTRKINTSINQQTQARADRIKHDCVKMLAPLIAGVGIPRRIWLPMMMRHARHLRDLSDEDGESSERSRIFTELKLHGKQATIARTIAQVRDDVQLFILGSTDDPWYEEINPAENIEVHAKTDFTHYGAHVWQHEETSRLIRDFCLKQGLIDREETNAPKKNYSASAATF